MKYSSQLVKTFTCLHVIIQVKRTTTFWTRKGNSLWVFLITGGFNNTPNTCIVFSGQCSSKFTVLYFPPLMFPRVLSASNCFINSTIPVTVPSLNPHYHWVTFPHNAKQSPWGSDLTVGEWSCGGKPWWWQLPLCSKPQTPTEQLVLKGQRGRTIRTISRCHH